MKIIKVIKAGEEFDVIFDDDVEINNKIHISSWGYASSRIKGKLTLWHRLIVGAKKGEIVDHINRNKLDNRRENLRIVTRSQNNANVDARGFYYNGHSYVVEVRKDKIKHHIGSFKTIEEASKAYQENHIRLHGEYSPYFKK